MMHLRARLLITGMISLIAGGSVVNGADEAVSEAAEKEYAES